MKKRLVKLTITKTYTAVVEAETREEAIVKAMEGDTADGYAQWSPDRPRIKVEAAS